MPALSGKTGLVTYKGGQVAYIKNWSFDVNTNMNDTTVWSTGTVQWRTHVPGLSDGSGTFGGFFVGSTVSTGQKDIRTNTLVPATGTLQLYMDKSGGEHWSVPCYFDGMTHGADIDATVDSNYSFQGTGIPTFTTTT